MKTASSVPSAADPSFDAVSAQSAMAEFRSGWPIAVAGAGGLFVVVIYVYSTGVFIVPLNRAFGWSRGLVTAGMTMVGVVAAIGNPYVGALLDKIRAGRLALVGVLVYAAAVAGLCFAGPSSASWLIGWFAISIASLAICVPVWLVGVVRRFERARGLALAIGYCGSSIAAMVIPYLTERFIGAFGWRGAYFALGGLALLVGVPSAILVLRFDARMAPPAAAVSERASPERYATLKTPRFWRIAAMSLLFTLGVIALTVHFVPLCVENGVDRQTAAGLAGLIGIGGLIGRLTSGVLLDRFPGTVVGAVVFLMPATGCFLLLAGSHGVAIMAFVAMVTGISLGAELDIMAYTLSRYFNIKIYGYLFGILTGVVGCGAGFGPFIAGLLRDLSDSYRQTIAVLAIAFVVSAALVASLGRYPQPPSSEPDAET